MANKDPENPDQALPDRTISEVLEEPKQDEVPDEQRVLPADSDDHQWDEVAGQPVTRNPALLNAPPSEGADT
jgi:hypothetical protein